MSDYTLVVIDMQGVFPAANKRSCISNVKREIRKAIHSYNDIVFVEFAGCHQTLPSIYKEVGDYESLYIIRKYDDDGSNELFSFLKNMKLNHKNLKFCGVNTSMCVRSTVLGYRDKMKSAKLSVIADACNDESWPSGHEIALKDFEFYGIKVL